MRAGMFTAVSVLTLVLLSAAAGAVRLTEAWGRSFPVGERARFELENVNGNITVVAWDAPSIDVSAEILVKAPSKLMAQKLYEGIEIAAEGDSARVAVVTKLPRVREVAFLGPFMGDRPSIRVRYRVAVPRGTAVSVRTVNGSIELDLPADMMAAAEAEAEHGHVVRTTSEK
ncbi:MAG TPA: hypothetical protein VMT60_02860 [Candidatus Bathyarchaeia archaeon]|nr:hypothetical protein [Candidatus Bathyarchaeia archaeon]